jgi:hypothetical protein
MPVIAEVLSSCRELSATRPDTTRRSVCVTPALPHLGQIRATIIFQLVRTASRGVFDGAGTHHHFGRKGQSKRTARRDSGWRPAGPLSRHSAKRREKLGLSLSTKRQVGAFPKVDLVNARKLARDAVTAIGEGRNPGVEKKATRHGSATAPTTIGDLAERFLQRYARRHTRERTWRETARILGFKPDPTDPEKLIRTGDGVASTWKGKAIAESKYPPAKPGALCCEPLKAAIGGADATPADLSRLKAARAGR